MTAAIPDTAGVLVELRRWIKASWDPELSLVHWRELLADAGSRDVPFRDLKKGIQEQEARSLCQLLCLPMSSRTCGPWHGGSWRRNRRSARYGG